MKGERSMEESDPIKHLVRGIVIASEWNEEGLVLGVCIKTFNDDEYDIPSNEAKSRLMGFIGREVAVYGTVQSIGTRKCLTAFRISKPSKDASCK